MLPECELKELPNCLVNDYERFDQICSRELAIPISVNQIVNESDYCDHLLVEVIKQGNPNDDLNLNDHLAGLNHKVGLYQLWIELEFCEDHNLHTMLCVYVGKGHAKNRVLKHIQDKFPHEHTLYITFFACENRLAKYLEQLFLDTYDFYLNSEENFGKGNLYGRWSQDRVEMGTELYSKAEVYAEKFMRDIPS